METPFPWNCPYCNHNATITHSNYSTESHEFDHNNKEGHLKLITKAIVCPNAKCKEYAISASLHKCTIHPRTGNWNHETQPLLHWNMKPRSQAKVFPSYIPKAIVEDYEEACLIRDLSPKASATLSRRCLQSIIRDFHGITKKRLVDEIEALQEVIDPLIWQAIDAVRSIGNIGAHMEKDINLIIEVEPQEASALIGLIEILLKDWYVARHEKQKQLQRIVTISNKKQQIKTNVQPAKPASP